MEGNSGGEMVEVVTFDDFGDCLMNKSLEALPVYERRRPREPELREVEWSGECEVEVQVEEHSGLHRTELVEVEVLVEVAEVWRLKEKSKFD